MNAAGMATKAKGGRPRGNRTERIHTTATPETKQLLLTEAAKNGWNMGDVLEHLAWTAFEHEERIRALELRSDAQDTEIKALIKQLRQTQKRLDDYKALYNGKRRSKGTGGAPVWV